MTGKFSIKRICALLLAAALILTMASCKPSEDGQLIEYEIKRAQIQLKKQSYIDEQYKLRGGAEEYAGNNSFMSLVFVHLDTGLYDDVLPLLNDTDTPLSGVMALSLDELPGMEGNITLEQYRELTELGWESTMYWKGLPKDEGDSPALLNNDIAESVAALDSYLTELSLLLESLGIDVPSSLVLGVEISDNEYESVLSKHGVQTVLSDDTVNNDIVEEDKPDGIWYPGIIGWRDLNRSTRVKRSVETGVGYAAFMISFDNSKDNYDKSFYAIEGEDTLNGVREAVFVRMLNNFRKSVKAGTIEVVGVDEARGRMVKYYDAKAVYYVESTARIAELDLLIEEAERELFLLYNEYFSSGGQ